MLLPTTPAPLLLLLPGLPPPGGCGGNPGEKKGGDGCRLGGFAGVAVAAVAAPVGSSVAAALPSAWAFPPPLSSSSSLLLLLLHSRIDFFSFFVCFVLFFLAAVPCSFLF